VSRLTDLIAQAKAKDPQLGADRGRTRAAITARHPLARAGAARRTFARQCRLQQDTGGSPCRSLVTAQQVTSHRL
jgi:hypothetical protein